MLLNTMSALFQIKCLTFYNIFLLNFFYNFPIYNWHVVNIFKHF